jgi:hypothetical protein
MKKGLYYIAALILVLTSCKDDDIDVFDKSSDERAAEAIATLKADLTGAENGWLVKYQPESGSGAFYVIMKFTDDNKVNIRTDLGANSGEFFNQTVTYRIDNSLGLELIIQNYSFFSFLFEQDQATFGAEFEFNYANKTPDGALVFSSKSDLSTPTVVLFQEASATDINVIGTTVATNLNTMADDLDKFTSSFKLTYTDKDLVFYIAMDVFKRVINITSASRKSNTSITQAVDFTEGYVIKGDSIVFNTALAGTFLNNNITLKGIKLNTLTNAEITVCTDPIPTHAYTGVTSANHAVVLESSLVDVNGKTFATTSDFYSTPIQNIFDNGFSARDAIAADITGAAQMQLYYNYNLGGGQVLNAIGFRIVNADGTATFALREFTPTLVDNNLIFDFAPDITVFGNPQTDANIENINIYLNILTEGDHTYVFEYAEGIYEFYNPCNGWSFIFLNGN